MTHFSSRLRRSARAGALALTVLIGTTAACSAATLTVLNNTDSGTGSLRKALLDSRAGDTISFDPTVTGTITLTSGELAISHDLTITGPGARVLALDGNTSSRIFNISGGTVQISGLTIQNGSSTGAGGAVMNTGRLTATSCKFYSNSGQTGGAIYSGSSGPFDFTGGGTTLKGDTFDGNTATTYGGAFVNTSLIAGSSATNCTFSGNSAANGGGLLNSANLTVTNCTFSGNSATSSGGGLYSTQRTTVTGSLFAGNTGGDIHGSVTSGGSNLLGDADGNGLTNGTNHDQTGVSTATANLGALADNGGPTPTCAVLTGSPAIGGDYALATSTDQRGLFRITAQHTSGAYEVNASVTPPLTSITVTAASSPAVGATDQLTATATYSDNSTQDVTAQVTWSSLNPTVATVDAQGLVTPQAAGMDTIGASYSGQAATLVLGVTNPQASTTYQALWVRNTGDFSVWDVPLGGYGFVPHDFDPIPGYTPQSVATTPDGHGHVLLTAANGSIKLIDEDGTARFHSTYAEADYGPFTGWTTQSLAVGSDSHLRVLWTKTNGMMSLWKLQSDGSYAHAEYGPYPGWTVRSFSVAPDNTLRVLWIHTSGQISFWVMDSLGNYQNREFGPFPGWAAQALATGPDGLSHILWNHSPNGQISLWSLTDGGQYIDTEFGPFGTWATLGLAVCADDTLHIAWSDSDTTGSLWDIADTTPQVYLDSEFAPFNGWSLHSLSAAP